MRGMWTSVLLVLLLLSTPPLSASLVPLLSTGGGHQRLSPQLSQHSLQQLSQHTGWGSSRQRLGQHTDWVSDRQRLGQHSGWNSDRQRLGQDTGWNSDRQRLGQDTGWTSDPRQLHADDRWRSRPHGFGELVLEEGDRPDSAFGTALQTYRNDIGLPIDAGRSKRKPMGRAGSNLSIVNPLQVLRRRLMLEIVRRRMRQKQTQITANSEMLHEIGKRSVELNNLWKRTAHLDLSRNRLDR